jgi:2-polyprenyl-6-methoxyphenol hydroxylase-like FAD-dependent oxidoreductase
MQLVASWPLRDGALGRQGKTEMPETNDERLALVREFAATWAEPFRGIVQAVSDDTEVKALELTDWVTPKNMHTTGRAVLVGDAMHAMAMCKH